MSKSNNIVKQLNQLKKGDLIEVRWIDTVDQTEVIDMETYKTNRNEAKYQFLKAPGYFYDIKDGFLSLVGTEYEFIKGDQREVSYLKNIWQIPIKEIVAIIKLPIQL